MYLSEYLHIFLGQENIQSIARSCGYLKLAYCEPLFAVIFKNGDKIVAYPYINIPERYRGQRLGNELGPVVLALDKAFDNGRIKTNELDDRQFVFSEDADSGKILWLVDTEDYALVDAKGGGMG